MTTSDSTREQSEGATLQDAKAMLAAALDDVDVKKKLGDAYLKTLAAEVADGEALLGGKGTLNHAKIAEGGRVLELAAQLLTTMRDIRDSVKLANEPKQVQADFGVGADWKASSPTALVTAAHALEQAFAANPKVAAEANIDKQHRHDLTQLAQAIDDAHTHHRKLAQDRSDDTAARAHDFAVLRAAAHHIRLAAGILHRNDPAKLAHFASPLPHHQVRHKDKKAATTPTKA